MPRPIMTTRRLVPTLFLIALLALAPAGAIDGGAPPAGSEAMGAGDASLAHWVGPDLATVNATVNGTATLWIGLQHPANTTAPDNTTADNATVSYRAFVNVSGDDGLAIGTPSLVLVTDGQGPWTYETTTLTTNATEQGLVTYNYTILAEVHEIRGENTTLLGNTTGLGVVSFQTGTIAIPPPVIEPPFPTTLVALLVGGAVLIAGGAGVISMQRKREKARMNRAPRRSSVLREEALERAALKKPEQHAAVVQEIRQQEQVRERRRELQILDAKKADALKTIDLLKKRREAGGLTEHQYNTMAAKKQADLQRIEQEIAEMETENGDHSSAA